jgi:hypothetical protein
MVVVFAGVDAEACMRKRTLRPVAEDAKSSGMHFAGVRLGCAGP